MKIPLPVIILLMSLYLANAQVPDRCTNFSPNHNAIWFWTDGRQGQNPASEMVYYPGWEWPAGGGTGARLSGLSYQIRSYMLPDEMLSCGGVVTGLRDEAGEPCVDLDVWIRKPDGVNAVVGKGTQASCTEVAFNTALNTVQGSAGATITGGFAGFDAPGMW